jgi:hypothetical protein
LERFPRLSLGAVLSPPGWRTLENMLCGEIREPERELGVAGIAVRSFEVLVRRAGWPGTGCRIEAGATNRYGRAKHPVPLTCNLVPRSGDR